LTVIKNYSKLKQKNLNTSPKYPDLKEDFTWLSMLFINKLKTCGPGSCYPSAIRRIRKSTYLLLI